MKARIIYIFIIICAFCFLFFAAFKDSPEKDERQYNITFIRMKEGGQFWSSMRNGVRKARTDKHSIVNFYSTVTASDVSTQIDYIKEATAKGTDCIVITPCTYYLLKQSLFEAEEAGIKILSLFNEFDKSEESSAINYMTKLQPVGNAMIKEVLRSKRAISINALLIGSFDTVSSEVYIADGFKEGLNSVYGARYRVLYTGRNIDSIANQILKTYRSDNSINLIFALNDETSEALVKALKIINTNDNILSIVSSNSLINIESLETGLVNYIVVINSFAMGYQSIYAAIDLINGREVKNTPVDFSIVDKKNMFDPEIQKKLFLTP